MQFENTALEYIHMLIWNKTENFILPNTLVPCLEKQLKSMSNTFIIVFE